MRYAGLIGTALFGFTLCISACQKPSINSADEWIDLSVRDKPAPIINIAWHSAVFSAPDIKEMARLWREIGGFETVSETANEIVLRSPNSVEGYVKIIAQNSPEARPARPIDARAWDTGCYWSLMMRAKDVPSIIKDVKPLGWEPLTELAYLEFGTSKLNIIVLRHQITGAQVQLYERLDAPLPQGFPEFERISQPFNIMQMVKSQSQAYDFFQQGLGYETFYYGPPTKSSKLQINPLGIPKSLTTRIPYKAAIVYPQKGMEWGRFEMIEIESMKDGRDFSARCHRGNWGLIDVSYKRQNIDDLAAQFRLRGLAAKRLKHGSLEIISPDGAAIRFEP